MNSSIKFGNQEVNKNSETFIIAELSANHLQKIENAKKLISEAAKAGVNAIKLQTYTADTITLNCSNEYFQIRNGSLWDGKTLHELYKEAYTPWEWQGELKKVAEEEGLICFSSPFDRTAVDFLENINVEIYKVASFEIMDIPLVEYIASKGKAIIISTGIAGLSDIDEAVKACRRMGNNNIALLKCTSAYPAPYEDMNLHTIQNLEQTFHVISGLSDHTMGIAVPIAAVALGAKIIEKHFTLSRGDGGPDAAFSLEPLELKEMVQSIREVEKALGEVSYKLTEKMEKNLLFSRSLFFVEDIEKGEEIKETNLRSIRPGNGLAPKYYQDILGRRARNKIQRGTPASWDLLD